MNSKTEASRQMTEAWLKMVQGPGLDSYLAMNGQEFVRFNEARKKTKLPKSIAEIPGIVHIAAYLRALDNYLK